MPGICFGVQPGAFEAFPWKDVTLGLRQNVKIDIQKTRLGKLGEFCNKEASVRRNFV